jgi:hypothetical protein
MFHCLDIVSIFFPCWLVALTPRRFANGVETQISLFHCVWYQNSVPKISGSIPGSDIQRPFKLANFAATLGVDFLLLLDVNEWLRYECSDEGTYSTLRRITIHLLIHIYQKKKITLEIAAMGLQELI